jgi:hypothetical protein
MPRQVSDEILAKTKCPSSFKCLNDENLKICTADMCLNGICLLKEASHNICTYRLGFGYSYICVCPVRAELYKRYGI